MSTTSSPDDIALLFDGLRSDIETMPGPVEARLRKRLADAMLAAAAPGAAVGATRVAGVAQASWLHSRGFAVALALPLGGALGALGHAWLTRREAPISAAVTPVVSLSSPDAAPESPPIAVSALPASPSVAPATVSVKTAPRASSSAVRELSGLDGDLQLLEQARTRLADGDPTATLQLLRAHNRAYSTSPLQQERDALTIKALVAAGRSGEAAKRAEAFRARYPQGLLRDSVDRAVGKNP